MCCLECAVGDQKYIDFSKDKDAVQDQDTQVVSEMKTEGEHDHEGEDNDQVEQEVSSVLSLHVIQASLMLPLEQVELLYHVDSSQKVIWVSGKRSVGGKMEPCNYYLGIENTDDYNDLIKILKEKTTSIEIADKEDDKRVISSHRNSSYSNME